MDAVARWKPSARERLIGAAIKLFSEQGFAATTVPQIAERAGLTTRTYFRYFADKREVLFGHENAAAEARVILAQAPAGLSSAEFIAWALGLMARERFDGHRSELRVIQSLVNSDESLRERALRKREMLNAVLGDGLQNRGISEQQSRLLADVTVSALYIALEQWLSTEDDVSIDALALDALAALRLDLGGIEAVQTSAVRRRRASP